MTRLRFNDVVKVIGGFYEGERALLVDYDPICQLYYGYLEGGDPEALCSFYDYELVTIKRRDKFHVGPVAVSKLYETARILKLEDYR